MFLLSPDTGESPGLSTKLEKSRVNSPGGKLNSGAELRERITRLMEGAGQSHL